MVKRYLNCRIPCGVRQVFRIQEIITRHLNPRTPYGVRRTRERCEGDNGNLNPRTPYGVRLSKKEIRMFPDYLNPRTPYGVRRVSVEQSWRNNLLKSTHSIRSATAILYKKYSLFIQIAFIFLDKLFCQQKILLFFQRISSFYQVRISQGFHVHFPFALHKHRIT